MSNGKNYQFKFLNLTDYEQRLFLEKALFICHKIIAKKNFEIGILTSERDEARYERDAAMSNFKEYL